MSLGLRATVADSGVLSALSKLTLSAGDKATMLDQLGVGFADNNRLRFAAQVAPDGTPWIPSQRAIKQNGQTLRDTGALAGSIVHRVGADYVEVGTDVAYSVRLHYGTKNMPAREIVGFDDDDAEYTASVVADFLNRAVGGNLT